MITKKEFVESVKDGRGRPVTYDKEKHTSLLYDLFTKGKPISAFCAEANIAQCTFFEWKNIHPEFKEAYDRAINFAETYWHEMPANDPNFNFPYWAINMRNRFGFGKSRFKLADKKKATEMMQAAKEHLDEDKITVHDYVAIVNSAKTQAIIDGECPDEEKVYRPSTREELLEKKALLEGIVAKQAEIKHSSKNEQLLKDKVN